MALEDFEPSFDGLAEDVGRRADLRELVQDLARLPEDQREALVLFELGGSSQTEIARVLACPPAKVKALVFQARSTLIAERDARSTPCEAIREQLAVARGGLLRRGSLRRHLRQCAPCDAYRLAVAGQRDALASLLPVLPSAGLKAAVLAAAGLSGSGGTAAAAGGAASLGRRRGRRRSRFGRRLRGHRDRGQGRRDPGRGRRRRVGRGRGGGLCRRRRRARGPRRRLGPGAHGPGAPADADADARRRGH